MAADSRAMHHIAIASKAIAEASKRDSYAMKTIGDYILFRNYTILVSFYFPSRTIQLTVQAILTTVFLPGTFVSSLFSTTMFDFRNPPYQVSGVFWIYWAVTIPLTLVVVGVWRLWLYFRNRQLQQEAKLGLDEEKTIKGD